MLLIQNGYVYHPAEGREGRMDVAIAGDRILAVGEDLCPEKLIKGLPEGEKLELMDAAGCFVAPGLADAHVHFRDPGFTHKEDIYTGAAAAARGGYTTIVLMANTKPPVDNPETLDYVLKKGRETGIHIHTCANITCGMQGRKLTDMSLLRQKGAAGFTDDGIPILDESLAEEAMEEAANLGVVLSFHEEDPAYITNNGVNRGAASEWYGIGGSDRQAEIVMVERDVRLAKRTGAQIVIQHISTREGVELVREARKAGFTNIHAEATPHHFTLTEEAAIRYGTLAKMNPPLREEADRQAIIKGLQDGTIEMIATDHAPHTDLEKAQGITEAPSGIIGLETALSLGIMQLVNTGKLTMLQLLQAMSVNVTRLYGLPGGRLAPGEAADVIVVDPKEKWSAARFLSKSQNSPFLGSQLEGRVKATICGGKIIYHGA